jgi:lipopolysaccharide transport system permease protein
VTDVVDGTAPALDPAARELPIVTIAAGASTGWIDLHELRGYRDLLYYLVRRDIVVRYLQTVLGPAWAVIQPVTTMIVFTIFFGRVAHISSHGVPYALFSLTALVPWGYFTNGVSAAGASVVGNASMMSKVYFPRIFIPLTPLFAALVDFAVALAVLACMMGAYRHPPSLAILLLPMLILLLVAVTAGVGIWLAALSSRYRDVRFATSFALQLLLFASPVIFDVSTIPKPIRYAYALNPMVGIIDGFRSALLGTKAFPWTLIGIGTAVTVVLVYTAGWYFRRTEAHFAELA